jgi:hypothetical protein
MFIKTLKISEASFGSYPYFPTGMAKILLRHLCGEVRVWAKLAIGILLEGTLNLIPTEKIEMF